MHEIETKGLSVEELEAQTVELLPERVEMTRRSKGKTNFVFVGELEQTQANQLNAQQGVINDQDNDIVFD